MVSFEKLDSASLIDSIRGALLGKILSGELRPGDRLPAERDMAAQLGVSRSSLHHAVLQLETQGFLEIEPRRGTVVADYRKHPTPSSLSALVYLQRAALPRLHGRAHLAGDGQRPPRLPHPRAQFTFVQALM